MSPIIAAEEQAARAHTNTGTDGTCLLGTMSLPSSDQGRISSPRNSSDAVDAADVPSVGGSENAAPQPAVTDVTAALTNLTLSVPAEVARAAPPASPAAHDGRTDVTDDTAGGSGGGMSGAGSVADLAAAVDKLSLASTQAGGTPPTAAAAAADSHDVHVPADTEAAVPPQKPLRDYQRRLVGQIYGHIGSPPAWASTAAPSKQPSTPATSDHEVHSVLVYLPTGGGKTRVALEIMRNAHSEVRAVVGTSRRHWLTHTLVIATGQKERVCGESDCAGPSGELLSLLLMAAMRAHATPGHARQTVAALAQLGFTGDVGVVAGGTTSTSKQRVPLSGRAITPRLCADDASKAITVASIQSLRRLDDGFPNFDLVVVDEVGGWLKNVGNHARSVLTPDWSLWFVIRHTVQSVLLTSP